MTKRTYQTIREAVSILMLSPFYFRMNVADRLTAARELAGLLTLGETIK